MSRISNQALLAKLTTRQWSGQKRDREVSQNVTTSAHADPATGSFYKKLAHSHLFSEFGSVAQAARSYHNEVTLPWLDGGYRLLPTDLFFDYQDTIAKYRQQAADIARSIREEYPRMVRQAQYKLGDLYKPEDFPTAEQVEASFGIEVSLVPVPDVDDFRLAIDDDTMQAIRNEVAADFQARERAALMEAWGRLQGVVKHLSERLHEVDRAERKRLHESVVTHVRDLVEVLPRLNVTGDSELDQLAQEAKQKLVVDINQLRSSPDTRTATATAADDLLARINGAMQQR